jgi:anti-sigma factor ChrR (cupin superfamily)
VSAPDFDAFCAAARADGYGEVLRRDWAAGEMVASHEHDFAARGLVVRGEMWLTQAGATRHLAPGDGFELEAHVAHSERYGPSGACLYIARRSLPAG